MKQELLDALLELIKAQADEQIEEAFGRDSIHEAVRFDAIKDDFVTKFVEE